MVAATLRVIAKDGFKAVTIRKVAAELNKSTTVVTHYFADRDALLRETVSEALILTRASADTAITNAEDRVWAFLEWSIDADPNRVWPAVIAASAAGIEPQITEEARSFDDWWVNRLSQLLEERLQEGSDFNSLAKAIGIAVDGLVLGQSIARASTREKNRLLHLLVDPLIPMKSSTS